MNQIRSAVDVYQENIHLRKELETMNEKFSKLKTENTELSIRYNYFKIVSDNRICLSSVNFRNYDQGDIFNQFSITYSTLNEQITNRRVLYFKDIALIIDSQYEKIRVGLNIEALIPSLYAIKKCREYIGMK